MLEQDYFTKDEIVETLKSAQNYCSTKDCDDLSKDFDDLFDGMFDNHYYIIETYEAAKALATFKNNEKLDGYKTKLNGVFGAIELVKQYEIDLLLSTPLDNPQRVANMVEYIRGQNLFNEALDKAGLDMEHVVTQENIQKFIAAATTL